MKSIFIKIYILKCLNLIITNLVRLKAMKNTYPQISCVIAAYNSEKTINKCLESIRTQEYSQDKIKIILVDGGSKDNTLAIARRWKTQIISSPPHLQSAEYNKGIGVNAAQGEFLLFLDHDNILPHAKWLQNMLQPMLENKDVVGVETLYMHYDRSYSLLDRYLALFGSLDPVAHYLGKVDKLLQGETKYSLFGEAKECKFYFIVRFSPSFVPAIGSNGFLGRRKIIVENADIRPSNFFHTDVQVDLIRKGFNTYAFIKDDIIHLTGYQNICGFLARRKLFMEQYHVNRHNLRRHSIFQSEDTLQLIKFIFYALTFVRPTYDAIRGYSKIKDRAWFLHPILCFMFLLVYGYVITRSAVNSVYKKIIYNRRQLVS